MHGALICLNSKLQPSMFLGVGKSCGLPLACSAWFSLCVLECEGRSVRASGRREDDLSFVVSGLPVCSASS